MMLHLLAAAAMSDPFCNNADQWAYIGSTPLSVAKDGGIPESFLDPATGLAVQGMPIRTRFSGTAYTHVMPPGSPLQGQSLKLRCCNTPCEWSFFVYQCPPCSNNRNGGLPASLISFTDDPTLPTGFAPGACKVQFTVPGVDDKPRPMSGFYKLTAAAELTIPLSGDLTEILVYGNAGLDSGILEIFPLTDAEVVVHGFGWEGATHPYFTVDQAGVPVTYDTSVGAVRSGLPVVKGGDAFQNVDPKWEKVNYVQPDRALQAGSKVTLTAEGLKRHYVFVDSQGNGGWEAKLEGLGWTREGTIQYGPSPVGSTSLLRVFSKVGKGMYVDSATWCGTRPQGPVVPQSCCP
eukprot:TRINITY_DN27209_c3_g2_i1.p1 TRINITY_DN27209_c3_g2~~TRINITY_DN27209_c3_g2_i1.p1  ORF type:complete len:348 (+),score=114.99 TRINITY_DN27209_c3_g2_i1:268-1311(+)